jgi:hypothetical protein
MINRWGTWAKIINHGTLNENRSIDIHWKIKPIFTDNLNEYPMKIQLLFTEI